jgi:GT2 family glycosyltransferase
MALLDVILVVHDRPAELLTIIDRLDRFTVHPWRLIVVDNASTHETRAAICARTRTRTRGDSVVILSGANRFCCHATNLGLSAGDAPFAVYLCSREAFPMRRGWDDLCLRFMDARPRVGLAGTRVIVPRYRTGADLIAQDFFQYFRAQEFARTHPGREMSHIQGGFWVLRREMLQEIGYFNERLYHNYMDVEYGYYAESRGWQLGDIPEVRVRHAWNWTPAEDDGHTVLYHPVTLEGLRALDAARSVAARGHDPAVA